LISHRERRRTGHATQAHLCLEEDVGVGEEAFLKRDDDELAALEAVPEELADVLRVREIQRGVDLVEDVHRRRLKLQERHDERERNERSAGKEGKEGRQSSIQSWA
jgi:hypothetical protein